MLHYQINLLQLFFLHETDYDKQYVIINDQLSSEDKTNKAVRLAYLDLPGIIGK